MAFINRLLPTLLILTVFTAAQGLPAAQDSAKKPLLEKGKIQGRSYHFKEAEKDMGYTLYVPRAYTPKKKWPLIVALHGFKSNPGQMIHYPGFTSLAEKHGYIIVCPMGYNTSAWYGAASFVSRKIGKLSEQDVMNVLGIARKDFNVDPDRIYLLGHSMGGGGTFHLGMKYPELWAALAPIAPAIYSSPKDLVKIRHIPIICIQGAKDKLVKASGTRKWIAKMKELEMEHQYIEEPEGGHVIIAFQKMPDIFKFFNKHTRKSAKEKKTEKKDAPSR
tara:strand:- start:1762 stop:2589 length:828 start_codon:yes stop_codon:yes gene_type:complete